MTEPLSPEREQEIRESIPTVYEAPWTVQPDMEDDTWHVMYATDHPLAGLVAVVPDYGAHLAEFIATARAAVPELLDEIERLRRDALADAFRAAADAIELEQGREERAERERFGRLDHDTQVQGVAVRAKSAFLRRVADGIKREKDTGGGSEPTAGESTAAHGRVEPLTVSRFDVAMEPAPEEEQVFTVGAVADDGRPVALLFDPEARSRVAGWLVPDVANWAELLAHAASFEITWPKHWRPLLIHRSNAGGDRWWISDREGRRWHRELGFVYEAQNEDERTRTDTRFPLAEAWPLAHRIAAGKAGP